MVAVLKRYLGLAVEEDGILPKSSWPCPRVDVDGSESENESIGQRVDCWDTQSTTRRRLPSQVIGSRDHGRRCTPRATEKRPEVTQDPLLLV